MIFSGQTLQSPSNQILVSENHGKSLGQTKCRSTGIACAIEARSIVPTLVRVTMTVNTMTWDSPAQEETENLYARHLMHV